MILSPKPGSIINGPRDACYSFIEADQYKNETTLDWHVGKKNSGLIIKVLKGYRFESSVPRLLWWFMSPHDERFLLSALIHDWMLENGFSPTSAAAEWYDAARASKAPKWITLFKFFGVVVVTVKNRR